MVSFLLRVAMSSVMFVLVGCQGGGDGLDDIAVHKRHNKEDVIGAGGVTIVLSLPASPSRAQQSQDLRDGAALALRDTGGADLKLVINYGTSSPRLLLGEHLPEIDLSEHETAHSGKLFKFRSNAIDGVLEGLTASANAGDKSVAIITDVTLTADMKTRLEEGVKRQKLKLLGYVYYGADSAKISSKLEEQRQMLQKAETIVILGAGRVPSEVALALRSGSLMSPKAQIIGSLDWASSNYSAPALEGALIAMPNKEAMKKISTRFLQVYKRPFSIDAAYGYDVIAMLAAINRSSEGNGLTLSALTGAAGFKGTLGLFRLMKDGSLERPMTLYGLTGGALRVVDPEPDGF